MWNDIGSIASIDLRQLDSETSTIEQRARQGHAIRVANSNRVKTIDSIVENQEDKEVKIKNCIAIMKGMLEEMQSQKESKCD